MRLERIIKGFAILFNGKGKEQLKPSVVIPVKRPSSLNYIDVNMYSAYENLRHVYFVRLDREQRRIQYTAEDIAEDATNSSKELLPERMPVFSSDEIAAVNNALLISKKLEERGIPSKVHMFNFLNYASPEALERNVQHLNLIYALNILRSYSGEDIGGKANPVVIVSHQPLFWQICYNAGNVCEGVGTRATLRRKNE